MRGVIKGVLAEELQNSLRMRKEYESALRKLPKGCLALKNIRGHSYYYLVRRINKKVKYIYKGKIPEKEINKYEEAKILRAISHPIRIALLDLLQEQNELTVKEIHESLNLKQA